jgi:hypothetical protein
MTARTSRSDPALTKTLDPGEFLQERLAQNLGTATSIVLAHPSMQVSLVPGGVLAPHMPTAGAPVAADRDLNARGAPPHRLVRQPCPVEPHPHL